MTKPPVAMTIKTWPVMVAAVKDSRVFTVAITTKGATSASTRSIPDAVAEAAGLARGSAVVIGQYNHFTWLGYDIRPVTSEPSYVVGRMALGFINRPVRAAIQCRFHQPRLEAG